MTRSSFAAALLCAAPALAADFTDPLDGQFDMSAYLAENAFGFLPVPVIITEPAVDGGLGVMGLLFHEDDEAAQARREAMRSAESDAGAHLLPPSVSALVGAYTGNGSWLVGAGHMGFFKQGRLRYKGGGGYGDIDLDYYSLGGVDLQKPLSISTEALYIINTVSFRIGELPLFIGPTQRYTDAQMSPARSLGDLLPPGVPPDVGDKLDELLTTDITTSGVGLDLQWDTRDNIFTPATGLYYEFRWLWYDDAIGSDIDYDNYRLEGLNYFRLAEHWRAGVRLMAEVVESDATIPPYALPGINMRGIPAARYQGTHVGLLETELTWEINRRWSALAFVGAGRASDSGSEFSEARSQVSQGLGFRYQIARRYGFHVGIDAAHGPEDTVWYIQAGSAW